MKLQIIHLSDIHFSEKDQSFKINVEKMVQATKTLKQADECVIVISGDLTAKGRKNEYNPVASLLGAILKNFEQKKFVKKNIDIACVPGNHDIDFTNMDITFKDISKAYKNKKISNVFEDYLKNMSGFWGFAKHRGCFVDNLVVSKKVKTYGNKQIGFVMLNTAPLSLLGGESEDMGSHFLSDEALYNIEQATEAGINVLIMHHSIEWFRNDCKNRLRNIISKKYSLVLTGHEHKPIGESRRINGIEEVLCVQGNSLYGSEKENGFCTINIDLDSEHMEGYSFLWQKDLYVPQKIVEGKVKVNFNTELNVKNKFLESMDYDESRRKIDNYYIFPSLTYSVVTRDERIERHDIDGEEEFIDLISDYNKIMINGEAKSGKSLLAKRLYKQLLYQRKIPILINADDIIKKKIDKTIEYAFNEQYDVEDNGYQKFRQMDSSRKIVIFDDASLIKKQAFESLMSYLEGEVGKIIVFSEEKIDLNIRKQVVEAMIEDTLQLTIKPFLYSKRKKLINNVLACNSDNIIDIDKEVAKINDLINAQIKYFSLNPEFIINFVNQYEKDLKFQFSSGMNVFNIVYESSIRNRIIANADNIDATLVINNLRELAYFMHFERKSTVTMNEISEVVNRYGREYRQKVNVRLFLETAIEAKILVENMNEVRFKDHTLVAYFVAQALNQKHNQGENIEQSFKYLLKNLCFSINSDIVLFLALITNNPGFLNLIMGGAKQHFANQEELSFDRENVKFLMGTPIPIKNSVPSKKEKQRREEVISDQEEKARLSDLIELVNEYDYSEDDLKKIENQVMISFKYIEILSKALPSFCQNMKVEQQDKLVSFIYKCPNQFLFMMLKDISDNFEEFCNGLYEELSLLRKEKNIVEINLDSIKDMIRQVSATLVMVLYQIVAGTCSSEQSIEALNAFNYEQNSNYKLLNLMMQARIGKIDHFSKRARELDKEMKGKLEKSIIKYTVREYFLRNNIEIYGEAQSLLDHFFGEKPKQELKMKVAQKRITKKDRS